MCRLSCCGCVCCVLGVVVCLSPFVVGCLLELWCVMFLCWCLMCIVCYWLCVVCSLLCVVGCSLCDACCV